MTPPTVLPNMLAMEEMLAMIAMPLGRRRGGDRLAKMARLPVNIPAAPHPAMALPMMSAIDVGAVAHTIEPTSKTSRNVR